MTGFHDLLDEAARGARARQLPDGSLPPGHNGPYRDPETPVRNTAHWLVGFCTAWRRSREPALRAGAEAALGYLLSEAARPAGGAFHHRRAAGKDRCNGLVGQAWCVEALATAAEVLELDAAASVAAEVFQLHPFDERVGLWKRVEIDGRPLGWDATLNHQLWFAAAAADLVPRTEREVARRVERFLDLLPRNLALRPDGIVHHWCAPWGVARREPRVALRMARAARREAEALAEKELGYHAFNLLALARLRRRRPDHPFWRHDAFARLWRAARRPDFRTALADNPWGWPYNPTGLEMAVALEVFEGPGVRADQERWLADQLERHWEPQTRRLARDCPDPETLAARLYEGAALPDLALPAAASAVPRRRAAGATR